MHIWRLIIKTNFTPSCIIVRDENCSLVGDGGKPVTRKIYLFNQQVTRKYVSTCLSPKADATKMKPFRVFQGAKREAFVLNEELKHQCVVTLLQKGWMSDEQTLAYMRRAIGSLSFQKRLLAFWIILCSFAPCLLNERFYSFFLSLHFLQLKEHCLFG